MTPDYQYLYEDLLAHISKVAKIYEAANEAAPDDYFRGWTDCLWHLTVRSESRRHAVR